MDQPFHDGDHKISVGTISNFIRRILVVASYVTTVTMKAIFKNPHTLDSNLCHCDTGILPHYCGKFTIGKSKLSHLSYTCKAWNQIFRLGQFRRINLVMKQIIFNLCSN